MDKNIFMNVLPNGLRMVHVMNNSHVGWCGLAVNAGSRDDVEGKLGLAHFVEHTIFKGTTHRRAWHILNRMETVGGELNAYTTKEGTMLYSVFPAKHLERAIDLLTDLVCYSTFPAHELEREMDVVLEEVASYRDTPSEAIYDDFEDMIFSGNAMGHNILGTKADIKSMKSEDCQRDLKSQYVPSNMAFFSVGPEKPEKVFRLAEKHLGFLRRTLDRAPREVPALLPPRRQVVNIDSHQSHTIVGARVPSMYDKDRFALALLNNIVGGPGMNSLLNVRMRERLGLVYTVESSIASFTDCGLMEIYFGCEENHVKKSLDIIARTIDALAQSPMPERRLEAFKKQYCGQLLIAASNTEFTAMNAGKSLLFWNEVSGVEHAVERILSVTPEQLRQSAEQLTMPHCSVLTFR